MLHACRPTPLRVTVRFLCGKDFDFIDGDTCSLPLEDFFVLVKGKDNMSSKNIICCINTGEGLCRVVQLHTSVAAAIGIHAKIARHFDDGHASHNDTILELEFFTTDDLIENLSEARKVHLLLLSLKGEKYYLFADEHCTYTDILQVCNRGLEEMHFSSLMVCRDNSPIMTSTEMSKLNAGQIRERMKNSDWICQESCSAHIYIRINHEGNLHVMPVRKDSVSTTRFGALASVSINELLSTDMVCYTENKDGTYLQILGSTPIDMIWDRSCDNIVVNVISLNDLHGKGLCDDSKIAVRMSLPGESHVLIINFDPSTTIKDIKRKFDSMYCSENGMSVHIIGTNNDLFMTEAENLSTTVASLMKSMKPGVSLRVDYKAENNKADSEERRINIVSP